MATEKATSAYVDKDGHKLYVSTGISRGEYYMTARQKNADRGTHRVASPALPIRGGESEAQADLDAYAAEKGFRKWTDVYVLSKKPKV